MAIHQADSATKLDKTLRAHTVICGSHGGLYPAVLASMAGLRAVILNDAGEGLDNAGISGVMQLDTVKMAAATAAATSCRIGVAHDMANRGLISFANETALKYGVKVGMTAMDAALRLNKAAVPAQQLAPISECRQLVLQYHATPVVLVDSASLVEPQDQNHIVITGSHGGLLHGDPAYALRVNAYLAVFNDAGVGIDQAGISRLPALDNRKIAAVTVAASSARIGEAKSAWQTGIISHTNNEAHNLGARAGMRLQYFIRQIMSQRQSVPDNT